MSLKYGYIQANVQGTNKSVPVPGCNPFPKEQADIVVRCFRDGQTPFRSGMCMIRFNRKQSYYLRACSRKQTELTAAAATTCVFASVSELDATSFRNSKLIHHLRFPFASEMDIVNGNVITDSSYQVHGISPFKIDGEVLRAIVVACFARKINRTSQVYISLPDTGFDESVVSALAHIYTLLPYALRAFSGYITYPVATHAVPEFVSLCFIPESWLEKYPTEPVLAIDTASCRDSIQKILTRSRLDQATVDFIDFVLKSTPENRKKLFDYFYSTIEGEGDSDIFSVVNGRLYIDSFTLIHSWNGMPPEAKDDFAFKFATSPKPEIAEAAWVCIERHLSVDKRFSMLGEQAIEGCLTFAAFATKLQPLCPFVKQFASLKSAWNSLLFKQTGVMRSNEKVKADFDAARPFLQTLFDAEALKETENLVLDAHKKFVAIEYQSVTGKIRDVRSAGIATFLATVEQITSIAKVDFEENIVEVQNYASNEIAALFESLCDNDKGFLKYDAIKSDYSTLATKHMVTSLDAVTKIKDAWEKYDCSYRNRAISDLITKIDGDFEFVDYDLLGNEYREIKDSSHRDTAVLDKRWEQYERDFKEHRIVSNSPLDFFKARSEGKEYKANANWTLTRYLNDFFKFLGANKFETEGITVGKREWDVAFTAWERLNAEPYLFVDDLVVSTNDPDQNLHEICVQFLRIDAFTPAEFDIVLSRDELPNNRISLRKAQQLVEQLLSSGGNLLLDNAQYLLAVKLAEMGALRRDDYWNLLRGNGDKENLNSKAILAAYATLQGCSFTLRGEKLDALDVLCQYNLHEKNKGINLHALKDAFVSVSPNDKKPMSKVWDTKIKRIKENTKHTNRIDLKGTITFVAILVALACLVFTVVKVAGGRNNPTSPVSTTETTSSNESQQNEPLAFPSILMPEGEVAVGDVLSITIENVEPNTNVFWVAKPSAAVSIISGEVEGSIEIEILGAGTLKLEAYKDKIDGELLAFVEFEAIDSNETSNSSNSATSSMAGSQDNAPRIEVSQSEIFVGDEFSLELTKAKSIPFVYWTYEKTGIVRTVSGENQKTYNLKAINSGQVTIVAHKDSRYGYGNERTSN